MWWGMVLLVVPWYGSQCWVFLVGLGLRHRLLWFWVFGLRSSYLWGLGGLRVDI